MKLKASQLLDILSRARSVIETSEGADEHGELICECKGVEDALADITMTGDDEIIHTHDDEPTQDTGRFQGGYRTFRDGSMREDFGSDR
jgi:hypothetical protein